ncbi:diguanylate cyclase [Terrihabitans sp. B22-R8]|uniref:diguanylate cyclase n=1 Tax=Terrihabitans sp. B22-R8 TaxID=3425128 RepID=UPI00403D21CC
MLLDYTSLLLAVGFSGAAIAATLLLAWFSSRTESFLLTWAIGIALVVCGVPLFSTYLETNKPFWAAGAFIFFTAGLSVIYGASNQFRTRNRPFRRIYSVGFLSIFAFIPFFISGHDGISFVIFNVVACLILLSTAREYARCLHEAATSISILIILYSFAAVSFVLCAVMLLAGGELTLSQPPRNWAEDLNVIATLIGVTGIGAVSLALHQTRLARRHRIASQTDQLTGLMNRRALFELFGDRKLPAQTAILIFDIDHFKKVNDDYGHAVGDDVLSRFSDVLSSQLPITSLAARWGGEEFAVVLSRTTMDAAAAIGEAVREEFARQTFLAGEATFKCTLSAGLAFEGSGGQLFEAIFKKADIALYYAKRGGRNRVNSGDFRLVA